MIKTRLYNILKRWLLLCATSFCFLSPALGDEKNEYEIIAHRIRLHIFPSSNEIVCTDTITVRLLTKRVEQIKLSLSPIYSIEDARINGRESKFIRSRDVIEFNNIPSDSVVIIVLSYSGALVHRSEFTQLTNDRALLREEETLPHGIKNLHYVRLSIIVPNDWEAIAVGRLVSEELQNDSMRYVWEFDKPISGIGWICAGKFWRQGVMMNDIQLSVHLFNEDSSYGPKILSQVKDVLEFFSHRFVPYRFPKFSIVEVDDWVGGRNVLALATQSFILVKKIAFTTDDRFNRVEMILPHEIAHQWWPLTVFIRDEDGAFLAEGMCEYSALLYNESKGAITLRDSLNHHPLLRPLIMRTLKGVDFPLQKKADIRSFPTLYLKASYVHNMLRRIVGDTVFFNVYREYASRFSERRVELADFQNIVEELSRKRLKWFFDQWITSKGLPRLKIYNIKTNPVGNRWITHGRVRMVGYEKYSTFIEVGAETKTGIVKMNVWLGPDSLGNYRNDVPFEMVSDSKPGRVMLDPNGDVLKIQKLPVKFSDLRDPSDGVMIIGTTQNAIELLQLARKDSTEMDKAGWSITIKYDSAITLADLQQDRVFIYGKASENKVAVDLQGKFPISFRGDSVLIPQGLSLTGEGVFDSTLTLMQAIENPFIPQGLLYWIAPLSNRAESELLPFDHSWVLVRGKDEIASGVWEVRDEDVVVEIK